MFFAFHLIFVQDILSLVPFVFEASPALILLGGHWCPECYIPQKKWDYDQIAKTNPFFAQVWYPNHTKEEHNTYEFDDLFQIDGVKWDDIKH